MLQNRASRRRIITYAALVAATLLMLAASTTAPIVNLRHAINFALSPIQSGLSQATRGVTSIVGAVGDIDRLRRQNDQYAAEIQQLQTQIQQLAAIKTENDRLSALLGIRGTLDYHTEPAVVISRQATQYERVITLDRGTNSGIATGDPVLSEGGALAGMVVDAGSNYASVMLVSDTRSVVIGLDQASRATGEVDGRLSSPLAMTKIPTTQTVTVGDTVVTAGLDLGGDVKSPFPKGVLIGRVVDVQTDPAAIVQTALIQPAADLDNLEDVLVITDAQPGATPGPAASPGRPKPSPTHP